MKELTRILHDLDQGNKNADEAEELIIELFKEIISNTRNTAWDIVSFNIMAKLKEEEKMYRIKKDIMNIKLDDVKPK